MKIRKIHATSVSATDQEATDEEILDTDLTRIREAQRLADDSILELVALVRRENLDTSIYPQLAVDHLTQMSVMMSGNLEHCVSMVDQLRTEIRRQQEVNEELDQVQAAEGGAQEGIPEGKQLRQTLRRGNLLLSPALRCVWVLPIHGSALPVEIASALF